MIPSHTGGASAVPYRSKSDGLGLWKEQLETQWKGRRDARVRLLGVVSAGLFVLWLFASRIVNVRNRLPSCDALHQPGRLLVNLTSPLHTHWRPFAESQCPPLPKYLPALWQLTHGVERSFPMYQSSTFSKEYRQVAAEPLPPHLLASSPSTIDPIPFLRKRRRHPPTVLVIGDSVDRNGLVHFCQLFRRDVTISHYSDITKLPPGPYPADLTKGHGPKHEGWDQRGLMHRCEIPFVDGSGTAMRVINGFHYGMDALDEFNTPDHTDWHAPGRIENRIDELIVPAIEQLGGTDKVDVVQLHSGMWDLALFGMQDDKTRWSLTVPLTPEQLAWWQERMLHAIYHVRQRFPRARLVFRKLHRTDDAVAGTQYITNCASTSLGTCRRKSLARKDCPSSTLGTSSRATSSSRRRCTHSSSLAASPMRTTWSTSCVSRSRAGRAGVEAGCGTRELGERGEEVGRRVVFERCISLSLHSIKPRGPIERIREWLALAFQSRDERLKVARPALSSSSPRSLLLSRWSVPF
ncbi:uncharacterized protein RHTO_02916 [Rhodotorula toruloides NP11]|uniref:Uncharacterized protein n=1 Tax=Rhodotorula toruloides (strain NP11) TaxID=1130832 RepID=M7XY23_RHOT1|nr:uncharacterized protein RHTO_02916 [Rhodotorula toruloides NP11]EMS25188.1 hypothetical protein RHTO_02916 [Rhodotorula toruloides NP11]